MIEIIHTHIKFRREENITKQQALPTGSRPKHPIPQATFLTRCLFLPFKDILISTVLSVQQGPD